MRKFAGACVLVSMLVTGCGSDDQTAPAAASEESPTPEPVLAEQPAPEGCPTVEDFTTAYFFDDSSEEYANTFEVANPALFNPYLTSALPEGGCGFVRTEPGISNSGSGTAYRNVKVVYFNLGQPKRPVSDDLRRWAMDLGGLSDGDPTESDHFELPQDFSGWTGSSLHFTGINGVTFGEETIPDYTFGEQAIIEFALDEESVVSVVANTDTSAPGQEVDPVTAMAEGLPASFSTTFDIENSDGYTADIELSGSLFPFTSEPADSLPGEFEAVSSASFQATATNTTNGRNTPVTDVQLVALYAGRSAACTGYNGVSKAGDSWQATSFCAIALGGTQETELMPDEAATLERYDTEDTVSRSGLKEDSDALAELNSPLAFYVRFGGNSMFTARTDVQSSRGCQSSGDANAMWYVPMDNGWPDPICSR